MANKPTIALDFSTLDQLHRGIGQFRYVVDLVEGLAGLRLPVRFILLGSRPAPPAELAEVFRDRFRWTYRRFDPPPRRFAYYLRHMLLGKMLYDLGADLLHSLHGFVPLCCSCPVVATIYDLMYELFDEYQPACRSRPYRLHRWSIRRRVRRVLAISTTTKNDLVRLWRVHPSRIDITPLGTRFGAREPRPPAALPEFPGLFLLSPHNLEPRKNLAGLVRAFAHLRKQFGTLRLVLFGKAAWTLEREKDFDALVDMLGVRAEIVRVGHVTDPELGWLYRQTALFVYPSCYEGFGLPVLEAMANGACVVVRNASAMAEVVGDAGATVETTDPVEFAACLASLLRDPARRVDLGCAARQRAAFFTVERMAHLTYECYREALAPRRYSARMPR